MHFQISWAGRARIELSTSTVFMAERDPDWADTGRAQIFERIEALREAPFVSSIFQEHARLGEVREVLAGSYRIFFTVDVKRRIIEIRRIRHVRQADPEIEE